MLLTRNQELIKGKRILDLASHDGRFSYACLKLGATHVTGVEGREYLVRSAIDNLSSLGCVRDSFNFIQDEVFEYLATVNPKEFDTILCFGFFDHTIRQIELVAEIQRIQPNHCILDMFMEKGVFIDFSIFNPFKLLKLIIRDKSGHFPHVAATFEKAKKIVSIRKGGSCLIFRAENHLKESATIDPIDLAARPTSTFLELVFKSYGFNLMQIDWSEEKISNWASIIDYKYGNRASYIAEPF
jgi:hypothetical protein